MAELVIEHAKVVLPDGILTDATLRVSRGTIVSVGAAGGAEGLEEGGGERIDAEGRLLTAGLIDLHIHGVERSLFELGPDDLQAGLAALPRHGVTGVLPTLYRVLGAEHLDKLRALAEALKGCDTVHAPGFHFEGPFLKLAGAGGLTMSGNVAHLDALVDATGGAVEAVSVSPDTAGVVPVIERLTSRGIATFMTHTRANVPQTVAAIEAGARHATHFYDLFELPESHEPGVRPVGCVEAVLADARVSVDFIADGVHVDPMAIRAAIAAKGGEGRHVVAISDASIGAGLRSGIYDTPWGYPVRVKPGDAARIELPSDPRHGALAGSAITLAQAVANLRRWLDLPEHQIWAMATTNPADVVGWAEKGRLAVGADADMVLWDVGDDGELSAKSTWVRGRCVHDQSTMESRT